MIFKCRVLKGYLPKQVPYVIIYSERQSDMIHSDFALSTYLFWNSIRTLRGFGCYFFLFSKYINAVNITNKSVKTSIVSISTTPSFVKTRGQQSENHILLSFQLCTKYIIWWTNVQWEMNIFIEGFLRNRFNVSADWKGKVKKSDSNFPSEKNCKGRRNKFSNLILVCLLPIPSTAPVRKEWNVFLKWRIFVCCTIAWL